MIKEYINKLGKVKTILLLFGFVLLLGLMIKYGVNQDIVNTLNQ